MPPRARTTTSLPEGLAIVGLCFGLSIISSWWVVLCGVPVGTGGSLFTDSRMLGLVVWELSLGAAAVAALHARRYDVRSLVPQPTWAETLQGLGLAAAGLALYYGLAWLAWAFGGPSGAAAPAAAQAAQQAGLSLTAVSLPVVLLAAVVNGSYEEVLLLGFLLRGLRGWGLATALGAMLLVRVLYHTYQGPLGATWMLALGLLFGLAYLRSGRLWAPVCAHIVLDVAPFLMQS